MTARKNKKAKTIRLKNMGAFLELRDAVLKNFEQCEKACDKDIDFFTMGKSVNAIEAYHALKPLHDLAKKCR